MVEISRLELKVSCCSALKSDQSQGEIRKNNQLKFQENFQEPLSAVNDQKILYCHDNLNLLVI